MGRCIMTSPEMVFLQRNEVTCFPSVRTWKHQDMIKNYHYGTRWIYKFTYPLLWTHNDIPTYPTNRVLLPTVNTFIFTFTHCCFYLPILPVFQSKMSTQYTIYTSTYYICVTINNGNCEINVSPWTDETPLVFPPMILSTDEAYNSFML